MRFHTAVLAFLLCAGSAPAFASSISYTTNFAIASDEPDQPYTIYLPGFDPALGTLQRVYFNDSIALSLSVTWRNVAPVSLDVPVAGRTVFRIGGILAGDEFYHFSSGLMQPNEVVTKTGPIGTSNPFIPEIRGPEARWITPDLVPLAYTYSGLPEGQFITDVTLKTVSGRVAVTYEYDEALPVPEPASIVLLGTGLVALGYRRWRR